MKTKLAIIGDEFMLPAMFEREIVAACGEVFEIRSMSNGWPDTPMEHGYAVPGMDGLKEYLGDADETCEFIADAEILVTHLAPLSAQMFTRLPNLKMVAVSRGGPVNIDMHAARKHGVQVVNTPGRNASAVAEFTVGAILAQTRRITAGHDSLRANQWRGDLYRADLAGRELSEMTVGIIGYGQIGSLLVKLMKVFGARLLVADPYVQLSQDDIESGVEKVSLEELLAQSDVVTLHPRVTEETTHMINSGTLSMMRSDAILINTARGPLVDYPALLNALKTGVIAGAMLETFDVEPVPAESEFLQLPNVTLTPHIAGASVYTITKAAQMAAIEIKRYLENQPPINGC
ncbi:oxidoreductase [Chromatiales bacterium (ex Bugula neritina AB1)]|nr:oxidoreductase [Chromatiales bacterium (ex Bugula neritina AB1)]